MTTRTGGADGIGRADRVALVLGTSTFKDGFEPLSRVPDEVRMMKAVLAESARCTIHPASDLNPTVAELKSAFEQALEGDDGVPPDLLIFYYSGHANEFGDGDLALAAHDSEKACRATQLRVDDLFALLVPDSRPRPREVVLLLDTCYAGMAVARFQQAAGVERTKGGDLPVFTAIGAIDRLGEAQQFHFTDSFAAAVRTAAAGEQSEFLPMDVLVRELAARMRKLPGDGGPPVPDFLPPLGDTRAFPNPWYLPRAVRRPQEANDTSGWAFCGRREPAAQIVDYLTGEQAAGGLVVTGSTGSGKSVLLDWIHTSAHGEPLPAGPRAPDPAPAGCLDLLLDVRGMTVPGVVWKLAAHYGTRTPHDDTQALLEALCARPGPLRMCFDSVEACADPDSLYADLLAPLAALGHTRVVMAGNQPPRNFGGRVVDLDGPEATAHAADDIAHLVAHVLGHRKGTTWAGADQQWLDDIARATAQAAGPSWLRAYLFAVSLSGDDPATARVRAERTTAELFLDQLADLDPDDPRWAPDLLLPVALAQGEGLPADGRLWAAVARQVSGRDVTPADLARVREKATDFLAAPEGGMHGHGWRFERSPHARYLAESFDEQSAHARFVEAMTRQLPARPSGGLDWTAADHYTREHFAHHARLAGVLDDYLDDPEFLLMMDFEALHRALTFLHDSTFGKIARVRSLCGELAVADRTDGHTLSRLALLAQVHGLSELARRAGESAVGWQPALTYKRRPAATVYCLPEGGELVVDDEGHILSRPGPAGDHSWHTVETPLRTGRLTTTSLIDASGPALFAGQSDGQAWVQRLSDGKHTPIRGLALGCRLVSCAQSEAGLLVAGTEGWQWRPKGSTTGPGPVVSRGRLRIGGAATAVRDGVPLVAARTARDVTVWCADGRFLRRFEPPQELALTDIAADSEGIYTGAGDGSVWWTSWDGTADGWLTGHTGPVAELRVHGRVLVSAGRSGDIKLTPLTRGAGSPFHLDLGLDVCSADVDPHGQLVAGTSAGVVRIAR